LVLKSSIGNLVITHGALLIWRSGNEACGLPRKTLVLAWHLEFDLR